MRYQKLKDIPWVDGIIGEVVRADVYRMKTLNFIPDVIFDLGANVGVFTRYAREIFPNALIVSVEPNSDNFYHLKKFTDIENWVVINKAIGGDHIWHNLGAANGSGESYVSSGIGYDHDSMMKADNVEHCEIQTILPAELIKTYVKPGQKYLFKIDIEGGEHAIFQDEESMELLRQCDYIAAETHLYALTGGDPYNSVVKFFNDTIKSFEATHNVERTKVEFYATKKC